ncbi:TolC family protein [Puniceicoccaceae bacterium K14]|nr:TolC family protein [Puniceicoccaceae bacterium K14]
MFSKGEESYSLGAAFSFPLLNRRARAQRTISEKREELALVDIERIRLAIQLEFHTSFEAMQTNFERVEATRYARELAEQSLSAEEKKLTAGTSSTFVVLRLQNDLNTAELREISAVASFNRSVADFNRMRGALE